MSNLPCISWSYFFVVSYIFSYKHFSLLLFSHWTGTVVFLLSFTWSDFGWCMLHIYCEGYDWISTFFCLRHFFLLWRRQNAEVLIRSSKVQYVSILVETSKNNMWRNYRRNPRIFIEIHISLIFVLFRLFLLLPVSSWFWFELLIWCVAFVWSFDGFTAVCSWVWFWRSKIKYSNKNKHL